MSDCKSGLRDLLCLTVRTINRLDLAGYDSVFMVALALIGVDVVLRCLMIEPKSKEHVKIVPSLDAVTEPLLGPASPAGYQTCGQGQGQCPDEEEGLSSRTVPPSRIPPIVRLAMSGQLLVLLVASIVDGAIWTAFETVCYLLCSSRLLSLPSKKMLIL